MDSSAPILEDILWRSRTVFDGEHDAYEASNYGGDPGHWAGHCDVGTRLCREGDMWIAVF